MLGAYLRSTLLAGSAEPRTEINNTRKKEEEGSRKRNT